MSNTQKAKEEIRRFFEQTADHEARLWPSRRREVLQAATNAGNVAQQNIVYVGKHGDDTNDGETINRAYLTFQAAISAASAGTVVVCLDAGDYAEDVTCATDVDVFAPNATLVVNGTDQLTLASCRVVLRAIQRTSGTADSVVVGAGVSAVLECTTISDSVGTGDVISIASGGTFTVAADTITGTIANAGTLNRLVLGGDSSLGGEWAVGSLLVNAIEIDTGVPSTGEALIYDGTKYAPDAVLTDPTTTEGDVIYRDGSGLQRLGIGTAGQLLRVNDAETAPTWGDTYAWRNRLINGDFNVWQRGTTPGGVGDTGFLADRWRGLSGPTIGSVNAERIAGETRRYAMRRFDTAIASEYAGIVQFIEGVNCRDLRGQTVTFSARIEGGAWGTILEWTGTEDSMTADPVATWGTNSTIVWATNYSAAGTIPTVGNTGSYETLTQTVTLGSTFNNLAVIIWWANGQRNVDIEAAQLEEGPYVTPFETRPVGAELAMCQRYYERQTFDDDDVLAAGFATDTDTGFCSFPWHVTKRSATTVGFSGNTDFEIRSSTTGSGAATTTSISVGGTAYGTGIIANVAAASLTAGEGLLLRGSTAGAWIAGDSEL